MKSVLYVEDSATSQLLMRKYVNGMCELTITASPRAGLEILETRQFDLVITDFLFPDTDATDLIVQLRKRYDRMVLPIIVISGSMDLSLLNRLLKAGANDGMAKPLNTADFRAMVQRMMDAPYLRVLDKVASTVSCFQWSTADAFFEYCPELDLKTTGGSREEVGRRMAEMLREHAARSVPLGFTTHEKCTTHVVQC